MAEVAFNLGTNDSASIGEVQRRILDVPALKLTEAPGLLAAKQDGLAKRLNVSLQPAQDTP